MAVENCIVIQFLYFREGGLRAEIVSQYNRLYCDWGLVWLTNCIAIQLWQARKKGWVVLQYNTASLGHGTCVGHRGAGRATLGHNTTLGAHDMAARVQRYDAVGATIRRAGARDTARAAQLAGHSRARCDTVGLGHYTAGPGCDTKLGRRHDTVVCTRLGRACARRLGVLLGCGLCTWCTQPAFDPV